jgi:polyhydroxyalkanoate synthesis regulator phasin
MKLEIERHELQETLLRLQNMRRHLEMERDHRSDAARRLQLSQSCEIHRLRSSEQFISEQLAQEIETEHAKALEERRQRRFIPRDVFRPKFASPWSLDAIPLRASKHLTSPGTSTVVSSSSATLREIQRMRAEAVIRCECDIEPKARRVIVQEQQGAWGHLLDVLKVNLDCAVSHRCLLAEQRTERMAILHSMEAVTSRQYVAELMSHLKPERAYFEEKLKREIIPWEVRQHVLEDANEKHRSEIRRVWEEVRGLRQDLLAAQQRKRELKHQRKQLLLKIQSLEVPEDNPAEEESTSRSTAALCLERQRVEYVTRTLHDVETRETELRGLINEKSSMVW